jgi:predicted dehydrogenase
MSAFKLGLIGGGIISRAHIAAAKASTGRVQIVASVDPAEGARQTLAQNTGAPVFASVEELFNRDIRLDGIVLCTPPSVRMPIVREALDRGVAVLVEKPLAHTLTDARALADLAAGYPKAAAAVGYCHRFVPAVLEMKRRLAAGELGELIRVENHFACWFPAMKERWMSDPKLSGGGAFIDTGCHSLDLVRFIAGDASVVGAVFQNQWPGRGESSATVLVRAGKAAGMITSGWLEPARFSLHLVGTRGLLSYDYDHPTELTFRPSEGRAETLTVDSHEGRFSSQLLAFSEFARGGDRSGLADFVDGLRVAEMVDQAQRKVII